MKGGITTEYTVWCAETDCEEWYQTGSISTKARAAKEFKHIGWKLIKNKGWVCPECLKKNM